MAMNLSAAGNDSEVMVEINTTPLIDVMLVLLIMLIITIPIQLHAVNLNMPTGKPQPPAVPPEFVQIDIAADNTVFWNGTPVSGVEDIEVRLAGQAALPQQPEIHLRPDRHAAYRTVAGVMAAVQRKGLTKIGLFGSEQFL